MRIWKTHSTHSIQNVLIIKLRFWTESSIITTMNEQQLNQAAKLLIKYLTDDTVDEIASVDNALQEIRSLIRWKSSCASYRIHLSYNYGSRQQHMGTNGNAHARESGHLRIADDGCIFRTQGTGRGLRHVPGGHWGTTTTIWQNARRSTRSRQQITHRKDNMANRNTKRKRAAGENGYGQKRGRALHTGFGQADGSPTRKGPKQYRAPGSKRWISHLNKHARIAYVDCTHDSNKLIKRLGTGPAHEHRIWSVRSSVRSEHYVNQLPFHADHPIINTCIRYSNTTNHWTSSSMMLKQPWCTWEAWRATSTDSQATRHTPYATSHRPNGLQWQPPSLIHAPHDTDDPLRALIVCTCAQ